MRIGLVVPGFSANAGDWCIPALRWLVERLATKEDVRVLSLRYPYRATRYDLFGARVIALGGGDRRGVRSLGVWRQALAVLAAEHRRHPFDVLHAFWANETGALAALAGRLLRVPTVVSLAGGELVGLRDLGYGGQLAWTERGRVRLGLGLGRAVTAGSKGLLEQARRWVAPTTRLQRIPLGVDPSAFCPGAAVPVGSPLRVVHVASLVPVKDQATLLEAAALLRVGGPAFRLEIVGRGPLDLSLRALAGRLALGGGVDFLGEVSHDRLPSLYRGSALFVLSSRHEAQGMAVLEAAACGVPTVGTRVGLLPEMAPEAAVAVPLADPKALAEGIAGVLADPLRRLAMGRAARHKVETEYGLETCVERFRELYATLA